MVEWRKLIVELADEKGMSIPQLANKAKVDKKTLYEVLFPENSSRGGNPSLKWLNKVACALDCELEVNFLKKENK